MKTNGQNKRGAKGFAALYVVLSSMLLIPMVGLAIDFSVLYNVKGRLQTAVDAAAIGSGSTLERSTTLTAANIAKIKNSAQRFFDANFPANYFGASQVYYDSTPAEDASSKVRSIYVHAEYHVPMLFMRVLGVSQSTVAAQATVKIRFVTVMIVVDRSGSVNRSGTAPTIQTDLQQFVATPATSVFVDGRDMVGMGSFSGTWNPDFAPTLAFQTGAPNIGTAIANIDFPNGGNTNTAEGLHQAYATLQGLGNTGALNVIILLTDGRPSGFTVANYAASITNPACRVTAPGFMAAYVSSDNTNWPPPQTQGTSGFYAYGLFSTMYSGSDTSWVANQTGCHSYNDGGPSGQGLYRDMPTFPSADAYGNSTTTGVYPGADGQGMGNPRAIRYAAFNAADNMAKTIRLDTAIRPVLFVIGLNEPPAGGEPLDADWLARVANDPSYKDSFGNSVFQAGQTSGLYFNVQASGLAGALQLISSEILRLSQ